MAGSELTAPARHRRLVVVGVVLALLLAGTVFGGDDDFPFGPFRMYSSRHDPNSTVGQLRVRLVMTDGAVVDVTDARGAPRRAELEGRLTELQAHPDRLAALARLYTGGVRGTPARIELVMREQKLRDGRAQPTVDRVVCAAAIPR